MGAHIELVEGIFVERDVIVVEGGGPAPCGIVEMPLADIPCRTDLRGRRGEKKRGRGRLTDLLEALGGPGVAVVAIRMMEECLALVRLGGGGEISIWVDAQGSKGVEDLLSESHCLKRRVTATRLYARSWRSVMSNSRLAECAAD